MLKETVPKPGCTVVIPLAPVKIIGCEYQVDFGPATIPRFHFVTKQKRCRCGQVDCPSIAVVAEYILTGGERAPGPLPPCPICGARTFPDPRWDGKYTHQPGWRCVVGGLAHFLQAKTNAIRHNFEQNEYLFPPVADYPGLKRSEILTSDDLQPVYQRSREEGYDPAS